MHLRAMALIAALGWSTEALAWGASGHEWATGIAIQALPEDIPAFVRDTAVLPELAADGPRAGPLQGRGRDPRQGARSWARRHYE